MSIRNDQLVELSGPRSQKYLSEAPNAADVLAISRRGSAYIIGFTLLGLLASMAVLAKLAPTYQASVRMVIEKSVNKYMQSNKLLDGPVVDEADTWTQIHIIASESVLAPVIEKLDLSRDPELVGPPRAETPTSQSSTAVATIKALLIPASAKIESPKDNARVAFDAMLRRLSVSREDGPNVISISYESKDPQKAAMVANAIADTYLESTIRAKVNSTSMVSKTMQERLAELKSQAANAEHELLEYKKANNLFSSSARTASSEQISGLNTHLATARIEMADTRARLMRMEQTNDEEAKAAYTPDNELITKLRAQQLDLGARLTDVEGRVGKNHLAALNLRGRMGEVAAAIAVEQKRIAGLYSKDYELAKARYNELTTTITQVLGEQSATSLAQARIRELESAAETLRSLYNSMLQRFSEANNVEPRAPLIPDARIVTRAAAPVEPESSKKRLLLLAGGSLLGLLFGIGLTFASENPFGVFRSAEQVKEATGMSCVILPAPSRRRWYRRDASTMHDYAISRPYSRFAETFRVIGAFVKARQMDTGAKVFCVVSSAPGEGKTTVASNLASLTSAEGGKRILLIDADFHRQTLTQLLVPTARQGLVEALESPDRLTEFVSKREVSGIDVLPCPGDSPITNAAALLGSSKMASVLEVARRSYDLVIIDVAPMVAVADFRLTSRLCDNFIYVIEWGKTSQRLVHESLTEFPVLAERAICVVLNKADLKALKSVERYKGTKFYNYYRDRAAA